MAKNAPAKSSLADAILEHAAKITRGSGRMYDALPDHVKSVLLAMRQSVRDGTNKQTKTAIGKGIEEVLKREGYSTPKAQEWVKWLSARD